VPVVVNVERATPAERPSEGDEGSSDWQDETPVLPAVDLHALLSDATRVGQSPALDALAPGEVPRAESEEDRRALNLQGRSLRSVARAMVNVQQNPDLGGSAVSEFAPGASVALWGEADPATNERSAAAEALADLVSAMLRPTIDKQGLVSFSLAGLGEFALVATGDRHQISLSYDDLILFNMGDAQGAAAGQGLGFDRGWQTPGWVPGGPGNSHGGAGAPQTFSFADLLGLFGEIVTYPPLLAGAFLLIALWGLWKLVRLARS
jgi:hypothetical protein